MLQEDYRQAFDGIARHSSRTNGVNPSESSWLTSFTTSADLSRIVLTVSLSRATIAWFRAGVLELSNPSTLRRAGLRAETGKKKKKKRKEKTKTNLTCFRTSLCSELHVVPNTGMSD